MKYVLKRVISSVLNKTGIISLLHRLFPTNKLTVLMFHRVDEKLFEEKIKYLKKNFNPVSEQQLYDYYYNNIPLPINPVCITFDDGYYNNYKYAYPILKKYNVPALIFLVTGLIGKQEMPWYDKVEYVIQNTKQKSLRCNGISYSLNKKNRAILVQKLYFTIIGLSTKERDIVLADLFLQTNDVILPKELSEEYRFMTWAQAKEMMPLISFGSHTVTHPIITNCDVEEKRFELQKSKEEIQKHLGYTPLSFCFPNGDFDTESVDCVKEAGYALSYSAIYGRVRSKDPFRIRRKGANILDNKNILAVKLSVFSRLFNRSKSSSSFKVVMLTNYYYPQTGGITTSVHNLVKELRRQGVSVSIFPFPNSFRIIEKWCNHSKFIHRMLVVKYICLVFIYSFFLRLRYNKVILHSHSANFCARAGQISSIFGCKTMHTFRTDFTNEEMNEITPFPFLNTIDMLTSCSTELASRSKKKYALSASIQTIYESLYTKKVEPTFRTKKPLHILYVGHLFEIKDPFLFIQGIEAVSKKHDVVATLVGGGYLEKEIKKYILEKNITNITVTGAIAYEDVLRLYAIADVFVLTSKGEGFGNVILEAMAQGIPVVATAVGGIPEIITSGKNGILVTTRTSQAIADAIIQAYTKRTELVYNAQNLLDTKFNLEKNTKKYINLYQQLVLSKVPLQDER